MTALHTIRKKSPWPFYCTAAVWILLCLILPMYKLSSYAILAAAAAAAYLGFSRVFPGKTLTVEEPAEPAGTGDEKIDALIAEGDRAAAEMRRLRAAIPDASVRSKIDRLVELTEKIFHDLEDDPSDFAQVRRFANYYLPTTLKLLNAYDRMSAQGVAGDNVGGSLRRIDSILDTTVAAYAKELDSLFANQALDIETDITVLETMLKREGLSGSDFREDQNESDRKEQEHGGQ